MRPRGPGRAWPESWRPGEGWQLSRGLAASSHGDASDRLTVFSLVLPSSPAHLPASATLCCSRRHLHRRDAPAAGAPRGLRLCRVREELPPAQPPQGPHAGAHRGETVVTQVLPRPCLSEREPRRRHQPLPGRRHSCEVSWRSLPAPCSSGARAVPLPVPPSGPRTCSRAHPRHVPCVRTAGLAGAQASVLLKKSLRHWKSCHVCWTEWTG